MLAVLLTSSVATMMCFSMRMEPSLRYFADTSTMSRLYGISLYRRLNRFSRTICRPHAELPSDTAFERDDRLQYMVHLY